jgi:hypothetical protein
MYILQIEVLQRNPLCSPNRRQVLKFFLLPHGTKAEALGKVGALKRSNQGLKDKLISEHPAVLGAIRLGSTNIHRIMLQRLTVKPTAVRLQPCNNCRVNDRIRRNDKNELKALRHSHVLSELDLIRLAHVQTSLAENHTRISHVTWLNAARNLIGCAIHNWTLITELDGGTYFGGRSSAMGPEAAKPRTPRVFTKTSTKAISCLAAPPGST